MQKYILFDKIIRESYAQNFDKNLTIYQLPLLYGILDESIFDILLDFFNKLNSLTTAKELDNLYNHHFKKIEDLNSKIIKDDTSQTNIMAMLKSVTLCMMLDNSLEYSNIQTKCVADAQTLFGNQYLAEFAKADKTYLSIDGKKYKGNSLSLELPECLKIYIVLKIWNDKLHYFLVNEFSKNMSICAKYLNKPYENNFDRFFDVLLLLLSDYFSNKLCSIDEVCPVVMADFKKWFTAQFGGKALGLCLLNICGLPIPQTWFLSVNNTDYDLSILDKNIRFAVRSSANIEDGQKNSFAGVFDSYLNLSFDELANGIEKVKNSVNNKRVQAYLQKFNSPAPQMAVILQKFVEPEIAGVWLGNGENSGILEWVHGNGEKLVSGQVTPNTEKWSDETPKNAISLNGNFIGKIMLETQQKLLHNFGHLCDIEFCVINNELIYLQFRPITKLIKSPKQMQTKKLITGIACSSGKATGKVRYINETTKDTFKDNEILMTDYTSPEMIDIMLKSKGIVSFFGGFLCHAGIIAREFDIPCVCGIGSNYKELLDGKTISLDGTNSTIEIIEN